MGKFIDLTNKKINDWIVVCREKENTKNKQPRWKVKCKCGTEMILGAPYLKNGWNQKDCGCSRVLIGKKFGMLTVLERQKIEGKPVSNWVCECECGRIRTFRGDYIRGGRIKSCGCLLNHTTEHIGPQNVFNHYKQASKKRNFEFSLNKEQLSEIIEKECFYCGKLKSNTFRVRSTKNADNRYYSYNGIDRVDNEKGYIKENCVSCCNICNLMKRGLSFQQWIDHIKIILEYKQQTAASAA